MFIFTDDYRLGITMLDAEHEKLVNMLNDALRNLQKEDVDLQKLAAQIKTDLQDYANTHFAHEEAYMEELQDPELPKQKRAHAAFIDRVNELPVDDTLTVKKMEGIMQYWVLWLFRHILHSDMMIGKMGQEEEDILLLRINTKQESLPLMSNIKHCLISFVRPMIWFRKKCCMTNMMKSWKFWMNCMPIPKIIFVMKKHI